MPLEVGVNAKIERLRYEVGNLNTTDDDYDGDTCDVGLSRASSGVLLARDRFTTMNSWHRGELKFRSLRFAKVGPGDYHLTVACEDGQLLEAPGGTEPWPVSVLWASTTTLTNFAGDGTRVAATVTVRRFNGRSWPRHDGARVVFQQLRRDEWRSFGASTTNRQGEATVKPKGAHPRYRTRVLTRATSTVAGSFAKVRTAAD